MGHCKAWQSLKNYNEVIYIEHAVCGNAEKTKNGKGALADPTGEADVRQQLYGCPVGERNPPAGCGDDYPPLQSAGCGRRHAALRRGRE